MTPNDFLHRTVTFEQEVFNDDGDKVLMRVTRTRTSAGHCSITASLGKNSIAFDGSDYEDMAYAFSKLLEAACKHPCALPTTPQAPA